MDWFTAELGAMVVGLLGYLFKELRRSKNERAQKAADVISLAKRRSEEAGTIIAHTIEGLRKTELLDADHAQLVDAWTQHVREYADMFGFDIHWPEAIAARERFVEQQKASAQAALERVLPRLESAADKMEALGQRLRNLPDLLPVSDDASPDSAAGSGTGEAVRAPTVRP